MQKKIKVLWLINIVLPEVAESFNQEKSVVGGWLTGLFKVLKQDKTISLSVVFPLYRQTGIKRIEKDGCVFFGVGMLPVLDAYQSTAEIAFKQVLAESKPDIVHIFGTEFPHTLAMVNAFNNPSKTLIHIQGLVSVYAQHYLEGIPRKIVNQYTLKSMLYGREFLRNQNQFIKRGEMEIAALKKADHVVGRTAWDKACTAKINPNRVYHYCNESLRDSFYRYQWDKDKAEKHTIFISQASYPIKGFHYVLDAAKIIMEKYPDFKIYVAGASPIQKTNSIIKKLKKHAYARYLEKKIKAYGLENRISFLGNLSEQEMCEQYLRSHVFVSASTIENSPNSVGEAMLLGVPVVSSDVGGVKDMMMHGTEGFVYQTSAPYMLAHYVCRLFSDDEKCVAFSLAARKRAGITHDRAANAQRTIAIYNEIMGGKS